jgi:AcrR family transcriptional regulator
MEEISAKKKAIFESTLELIRLHGFHGAPMSLIAKNASVAAGTIYHYFESKDHLIAEMYEHNKNVIIRRINEILDQPTSVKEKFRAIWITLFEYYVKNPDVLIFFEQYVNSPYSKKRNPDRLENRPLFAYFQSGIKEGVFTAMKADILLVLMMASITAAAKLQTFGNVRMAKADLDNIIAILWKGMTTS